jgi:hypothetical protein
VGRIAAGYDADILLVDGDPLTDISLIGRVRRVMRRGSVIERSHLVGMRDRLFASPATDPASLFITDLDTRAAAAGSTPSDQ